MYKPKRPAHFNGKNVTSNLAACNCWRMEAAITIIFMFFFSIVLSFNGGKLDNCTPVYSSQ